MKITKEILGIRTTPGITVTECHHCRYKISDNVCIFQSTGFNVTVEEVCFSIVKQNN